MMLWRWFQQQIKIKKMTVFWLIIVSTGSSIAGEPVN